jgi:hypothetical protein
MFRQRFIARKGGAGFAIDKGQDGKSRDFVGRRQGVIGKHLLLPSSAPSVEREDLRSGIVFVNRTHDIPQCFEGRKPTKSFDKLLLFTKERVYFACGLRIYFGFRPDYGLIF